MNAAQVLRTEPPKLTGMLGVLGGMGPLATACFYRRVIEATPSASDQDHVPVVIWGDPTVPDRGAALLRQEAVDPSPWLLRGARALVALGAELIAVPCNSAHPFLSDVRRAIDVPMADMVKATVARASECLTGEGRVAVLCTEGTYQAELYQELLRSSGSYPIDVPLRARQGVQSAIGEIKAGRLSRARWIIRGVLSELESTRPDLLIAGCTELTTLRDDMIGDRPVVDSATVLAQTAVTTLRGPGGRSALDGAGVLRHAVNDCKGRI